MHTSLRRFAVVTAAATGLVAGGLAAASAQNVIPGDTDPGQTIITGRDGVTITVDEVNRETGAVSGTFVNELGSNLNCTSPDANPQLVRGGTVSTKAVIDQSMTYYGRFQNMQPGQIAAGSSIPFIGNAGVDIPFWPLFQLLPSGSASGSLSDGVSEAADIANAHRDALMHGMVGTVGTFTVNNGVTHNWSTTLERQSIGERGTDSLGAIFVCSAGGQHFAFAGYEDTPPPEPGTGSLSGGSLGSGSGSGSGSSSSDSLGSNNQNPEDDTDNNQESNDDNTNQGGTQD